jgi:hypothetical protein
VRREEGEEERGRGREEERLRGRYERALGTSLPALVEKDLEYRY